MKIELIDAFARKGNKVKFSYSTCFSISIFRFSLELKRKSMFYVLNIILPCVMLSVLQLMVFRVPSAAGEKVSLSITLLLSFTVFLLMVSDNMPQTSTSVPLLGECVLGEESG